MRIVASLWKIKEKLNKGEITLEERGVVKLIFEALITYMFLGN